MAGIDPVTAIIVSNPETLSKSPPTPYSNERMVNNMALSCFQIGTNHRDLNELVNKHPRELVNFRRIN